MQAVTIGAGEPFAKMAQLAAQCFISATGCPARVLGPEDCQRRGVTNPHHLKFHLFEICPEAEEIIFFDADLVFLEAFDPQALRGPEGFSAALDFVDEWWIREDAARAGIEPAAYFNSGLFWIRRDRRDVLTLAKQLRDAREIETPFHDQTFLNAAAARTGSYHRLNKRYNYHVDRRLTDCLDDVTAAHIHWLPADQPNLARYYTDARSLFWRTPST